MDYIKANNRHQIRMNCLEEQIEADNQVRFIDAFVEKLDLAALGYIVQGSSKSSVRRLRRIKQLGSLRLPCFKPIPP
jgi:hypothetical protein